MLYLSIYTTSNPAVVSGGTTITGTSGVFNGDAVFGSYYPWTLTNYGALQAASGTTSSGVYLRDGGEVLNAANGPAVGSIRGYDGVVIRNAPGTLVNQGTISSFAYSSGTGAYFDRGGTVTNGASGATAALISGGNDGVFFGGPGTVTNFGRIEEQFSSDIFRFQSPGIRLNQGGTITNNGVIQSRGGFSLYNSKFYGGMGVQVSGGSAAITNSGSIIGGVAGIYTSGSASATVTNFGLILGEFGVIANTSNGVTLVNHGKIIGYAGAGFAAAFAGGAGNDRVVTYPGAVFQGNVNGEGGNNTLELAAGATTGTISGLGASFANFGVVSVDNGASWTFQSMQAATDAINLGAAQVEFSGTVEAGHTVAFNTSGATAKIDNVVQFAGTVTGFRRGDVLDFAGVTATGVSLSAGTLTLKNGNSGFATIAFSTPIADPVFWVTADGHGGTQIGLVPPVVDVNGDNMSDLLFQNTDGTPAIWEMNGTTATFQTALFDPSSFWHLVGTGDFNGDGKSDLLWQAADGTPAIWLMNGTTPTNEVALLNPGPSWHLIGSGDFNGDGKSDLLWQNDNGTPDIWLMNGTTPTSAVGLFNPGPSWHVIGAEDLNGDGKSDIVFQNDNGEPGVWLMNGTTPTFQTGLFDPGSSWHIVPPL